MGDRHLVAAKAIVTHQDPAREALIEQIADIGECGIGNLREQRACHVFDGSGTWRRSTLHGRLTHRLDRHPVPGAGDVDLDPVRNFVVTDDGGRRYEALPAEHSASAVWPLVETVITAPIPVSKIDVIELLARLGDAEVRRQIDPLQVRGQETRSPAAGAVNMRFEICVDLAPYASPTLPDELRQLYPLNYRCSFWFHAEEIRHRLSHQG